jgi:hypothetical protein
VNARVIPFNPADHGLDDMPPDDVSRLRQPPHSIEAEHSVLGALLLDPTALVRVSDVLTSADFYSHAHRIIFDVITDLATDGAAADIVSVFVRLKDLGKDQDAGGLSYLNTLANCVPSAANIRRYAEVVAERATLRALIAASDDIATAAFNPQGRDLSKVLNEAKERLGRVFDARQLGGSRRLPVLTAPQLIAEASTMRWLCKGILPADSMGMIFGASGTFKSFLAMDAALHVVHGLPWLGRRTEKGSALWIAAEGGKGIGHRVNAWHKLRRLAPTADFVAIPAAIDLGNEAWRVVDAVQATVAITPSLVIVDTLSQTYTGGADENSATDMAAYLRGLAQRFRDLWHCTVIVIHHNGHAATERPRGSSAIQANTDFLFGCWRDEKEMLCSLSCHHMKDGDRFDDAMFSLIKMDLGKDAEGDAITHLAARHLSNADEVQEAAEAEVKAGRGGKNQLLLSLLQNGMAESELRKLFMRECDGMAEEAKRQAYARAAKWAKGQGHYEVAEGFVLTLKR